MADPGRQTVTVELRLPRGEHEALLDALGGFYGAATRQLHSALRALDRDAHALILSSDEIRLRRNAMKTGLMASAGLTSRQFNAVQRGLEGRIKSLREAAKARAAMLDGRIADVEKDIVRREKALVRDRQARVVIAGRARLGKPPTAAQRKALLRDRDAHRFTLHQKKRKLDILRARRLAALRVADAELPPLTFGSRQLLAARAKIHQNDTARISRWRRSWKARRSGNFILIGSKGETAGNQTCQGQVGEADLSAWMKLPPGLVGAGMSDRVRISMPMPDHYRNELTRALAREDEKDRTAVAWRFVRDPDWPDGRRLSPWRVFITFEMPVKGLRRPRLAGGPVLGVDINADHIAACLMTADGNPAARHKVPMPLRGKSAGQRRAIIGDAAARIVALAKEADATVAFEQLDFRKKRQELHRGRAAFGAGYARMLSAFAHAQIVTALERGCARAEIDHAMVNPAYTSVIGAVNLARRYGLSRHQAAAGAIARRAQGHSERINYIHGLRGRRHARPAPEDAGRHMWHHWRRLSADAVRHVAVMTHSPPPAGPTGPVDDAGSSRPGQPGRGRRHEAGLSRPTRGASLLPTAAPRGAEEHDHV